MALEDDGDIVRGLGFVSMYAAWLEDDVDEILHLLNPIEPFDEKAQRQQTSSKIKIAARLIKKIETNEISGLSEEIKNLKALLERRNGLIHGRVFQGVDRKDYVKSGRPDVPLRAVSSAEMYSLANDLWNARGRLIGPQAFRLPRAIQEYCEKCS